MCSNVVCCRTFGFGTSTEWWVQGYIRKNAGTIRFYGVGKGYGATDDFYVETTIIGIGFFWDGFQKKWEGKFGSKLAELYAPVYQKYLTLDDLKKIVAFYESPVGKKLGASTPAMMAEGMQIGQKLGMEIATELQQELQAQGK